MSSQKLRVAITNPPPKFVRARYLREVEKGRGFITGENGSNVQLQVHNAGKALCFNRAKCIAKVKSVATRQVHTFYTLFNCEWDVTIQDHDIVKVDLDRLAVVWPNDCKEKQKRDMGEFYLEFVLRFPKEDSVPDLICHTEEIFDETCKETCRPKIKDVIPWCAAGGEKVCIQCTNDIAKISEVEAIFSGMIGDSAVHFPTTGEVDRNLVKIVMPCQYDDSIKDVTKLKLKLRVNKNDNIVSNAFTFGYLPKTFCRPKIMDLNEEVPNSGKTKKTRTFLSDALIELPSINTECGVVTGRIPPKSMSNPSNLSYDRSESFKAFHDTKSSCLNEKEQNTSNAHIDIVRAAMIYTRLDGQNHETDNGPTVSTGTTIEVIPNQMKSFNQEFPLPSIVAKVEPQAHKPESNEQDFHNHMEDVRQPKTPPNHQANAYVGLSGIQHTCNNDKIIPTPSTGKDLEKLQPPERPPNDQVNACTGPSEIQYKCSTQEIISNPSTGDHFDKLQTLRGDNTNSRPIHLDVSPDHNSDDDTCYLRTPNKVAPEEISRFEALTLSQMNEGVTRNHSDLSANRNWDMPNSSWPPCSPGMDEELPPGSLSDSTANKAAGNEQDNIAQQSRHVLTNSSSFLFNNNLETGTGHDAMEIPMHGGEPKESAPKKLSVWATNKNFNDQPNCHAPSGFENFSTEEKNPVQVTDENSPPQLCYTHSTSKNNRLGVPAINHSNDPSKPQPISDDNDFSKMDISLDCIISAHENVESNGAESWKDLREHVSGNIDILKEKTAKGTDKNMMKRRTVPNYPACGNHNPSYDLHGQPKTKVMKLVEIE